MNFLDAARVAPLTDKPGPATSRIWLHRCAVFTACCTFVLIIAGALVTSTDASLAVPDWPLSYGRLMPPIVGGIFYEHGHRMVAAQEMQEVFALHEIDLRRHQPLGARTVGETTWTRAVRFSTEIATLIHVHRNRVVASFG